jgi:hypothetical protein
MTTLARANAAIARSGVPLELERGEGYHYFIYDVPARGIYETVSIYVPYTNTYSAAEWANQAGLVYTDLLDRQARGY